MTSRPVHQICEGPNPGLVTAEYSDKAWKMFKRAQAAVINDSIRLSRVERKILCPMVRYNQRNSVNGKLSVGLDEHITAFWRNGQDSRIWK